MKWMNPETKGTTTIPLLSKSRFLAGLQCPLRLWYLCNEPEKAAPLSPFQKALFEMGRRIGTLARKRYPGGVLIDHARRGHMEAVRSTKRFLRKPDIPVIFEGAFTWDDVQIRADILERSGDKAWNLIEVKSGTSVKEEYLYDVAIQYHVVTGAGLSVDRAGILCLNGAYVYDGQDLDLESLFRFTDLTEPVREMQDDIRGWVKALKDVARQRTAPAVDPSRHCRRPYVCGFFEHCRKNMPNHWVVELLGIQQERLDELALQGISDIQDVPESFKLSMVQTRIRECVIHNKEYLGPELGPALREAEYPIHFLDFETVAQPIPRYAGTHPFETLPFQWSDHILADDGGLTHQAYLSENDHDPREDVARTLLEALGEKGTIWTYTNFESQVISDLAGRLARYQKQLQALLERCRDLYAVIRRDYYHPGFHGSFSIKNVLPVLVPSMSYGDLSIQEGGQAGFAYLRMIDPETPAAEREEIRAALWAYCRQDTLAMVKIREELLNRT
jgi:predicted RecB family nuclease